jgi:hypothetical protein
MSTATYLNPDYALEKENVQKMAANQENPPTPLKKGKKEIS